jgi:uncharacterized protein YgiM (DUF1202 family)
MLSGLVRALIVSALLLSVAGSVGLRSVAAADFAVNDVVVTTDSLNLRSAAGTSASVKQVLNLGQRLMIKDGPQAKNGYDWYKVILLGDSDETPINGWVAADFIALEDNGQDFAKAKWVVVSDGPVNVRTGAGTSNSIVTTMADEETASVKGSAGLKTANGYMWINVLLNSGSSGWVATDFLSVLTSDPGDGGNNGGDYATAEGVEIVDGPVNVRSKPSLSGTITSVQDTGLKFFIVADSDLVDADGYSWVNIMNFGGVRGWVATDFTAPVADMPCGDGACYPEELNPFFEASAATVTDGPVNLRASAGTSSQILLTLQNGDYLWLSKPITDHVEEADGYTWIQVSVAGKTGWIAIDFISPAD